MPSYDVTVKETMWNKANKALAQAEKRVKSSESLAVHCYIPLCLGYGEEMSVEELSALIETIKSKKYTYTVYLAPKDTAALTAWQEKHADYLATLPKEGCVIDESGQILEQVIEESVWRESEVWHKAEGRYATFREGTKKDIHNKFLTEDIDAYASSHPELEKDDIRNHQVNNIIDALSWMPEKSNQVNVLFYAHSLPRAMDNAIKNGHNMKDEQSNGYIRDSLVTLHPDFNYELRQEEDSQAQVINTATVTPPIMASQAETLEPASFRKSVARDDEQMLMQEQMQMQAQEQMYAYVVSVTTALFHVGMNPEQIGVTLGTMFSALPGKSTQVNQSPAYVNCGTRDQVAQQQQIPQTPSMSVPYMKFGMFNTQRGGGQFVTNDVYTNSGISVPDYGSRGH